MTVHIEPDDLDISVVRPGTVPHGSGGQTVGQFDPYVRITHRPTGITVERDKHRSQLMNKDSAMKELRSLLAARAPHPDTAAGRWTELRVKLTEDIAIEQELGDDYSEMSTDTSEATAGWHWGKAQALRDLLAWMEREEES